MCGRFTLTVHRFGDVVEPLGATLAERAHQAAEAYRPRYNVAPGDDHWIMRATASGRELLTAGWGLINRWSTDPTVAYRQINARVETLADRPAYREAYRRRRCVVPTDGFYEWKGPKGAREPVWFHPHDGELLLLAGLYEDRTDRMTGEVLTTFTIVTTPPNAIVRPVHDRMPAVLAAVDVEAWLRGERPAARLGPAPADRLNAAPASPRVNNARHDDEALLDPHDPAAQKQLMLF